MGPEKSYLTLSRKYRPQTLEQIQGQPSLVRILHNAITHERLGHAFLLHGIRGTGKTTTARVLARCLNCIGPDGQGSITPAPCGICDNCQRIGNDHHIDVIEMDAASHTGVDDIREIIESARYKPVSARFKVFIIDEVHMLSKSAFNALLKTLEEPPPHVKFILATTELNKVPETVLSRCMRFDLERIGVPVLSKLYSEIAIKENFTIDSEALAIISHAADGSARDGLSILDQAINTAEERHVSTDHVRKMLGFMDQNTSWEILFSGLEGKTHDCLNLFDTFYHHGGDPLMFLSNLLENTHTAITLFMTNCHNWEHQFSGNLQMGERLKNCIPQLTMDHLYRIWAILMKGYDEVKKSPLPFISTRMILIKICYVSDLPLTKEALEHMGPSNPPFVPHSVGSLSQKTPPPTSLQPQIPPPSTLHQFSGEGLAFYESVCDYLNAKKEVLMYSLIKNHTKFVEGKPGYLRITTDAHVPDGFIKRLKSVLDQSGIIWTIETAPESPHPTLEEHTHQQDQALREEVSRQPLVQDTLAHFPGAEIKTLTSI